MATEKKPAQRKPRASATQKYIRNIRYVPASVRINDRRIQLSPRGQRGDFAPVSKDEMTHEIFLANKDLIFEVLSEKDINEIVEKQTTNQQSVHPALSTMRNSKGEEYTKGVVIQDNIEVQGTSVGSVDDRGQITRFVTMGTVDNPGLEAVAQPINADPKPVAEVTNGQLAGDAERDVHARRTDLEGPEAGLGGLKIVKTDVQQS